MRKYLYLIMALIFLGFSIYLINLFFLFQKNPDPENLPTDEWMKIDEDTFIRLFNYEQVDQKGEILILRLNSSSYEMEIEHDKSNPKYLDVWEKDAEITINGSFFTPEYDPIGFLMIDMKRVGNKISPQHETGLLFSVKEDLTLRDLTDNPIKGDEIYDYAVQSYPFIIKNGKSNIASNSTAEARRTAIGMDYEGNLYIIISNKTYLSLYELMLELQNTGINFDNVLNLDGGPSTGISINLDGFRRTMDSQSTIPQIIKFSKK